jgi:heme-degrading monooxygenase HmoA
MIARHWRGWTAPENANAYGDLLRNTVLPGLKNIYGYRGGYVLRRNVGAEVEFVVVNLFDSIEAVQQFAGPDYAVAQFEPEARRLLAHVEPLAAHYEVCMNTVSA